MIRRYKSPKTYVFKVERSHGMNDIIETINEISNNERPTIDTMLDGPQPSGPKSANNGVQKSSYSEYTGFRFRKRLPVMDFPPTHLA
ncbi:hypothetical protein CLIB1423_01S08900 [[Candida] railenensis]|uniref:Uncharacterized protein n=1 Tax=[Candida] railenensis TaxID=45579 RepID=A0A9P0VVU6_9ASCO|nr:hypothetical protein CLIB1423_01S08900 [[Candida] railenensis]